MSKEERAQWRANEKSFVGHTLVEEGDTCFYTPPEGGHVSENLSPINDAAQAIVDAQAKPHPDKSKAKAPKPKVKGKEKVAEGADEGADEGGAGEGEGGDGDVA